MNRRQCMLKVHGGREEKKKVLITALRNGQFIIYASTLTENKFTSLVYSEGSGRIVVSLPAYLNRLLIL
jgi:hypothetical protein